MRHDLFDLGKTAVEYRGCASQHWSTGYDLGRFAASEPVVEPMTGSAREDIRERLVRGGEGIDAKHTVLDHSCPRARSFVDAKQHHGWLDRDRCDRGRGEPSKTCRSARNIKVNLIVSRNRAPSRPLQWTPDLGPPVKV
jgi:hypothetical protein